MNVNGKYLKDENGNIISPIVSASTIYDTSGTNLQDILNRVPHIYMIVYVYIQIGIVLLHLQRFNVLNSQIFILKSLIQKVHLQTRIDGVY